MKIATSKILPEQWDRGYMARVFKYIDDAVNNFTATSSGAAAGANADITSLSVITTINTGPLAGFQNPIINGNMEIAQRGTTAIVARGYGPPDRWYTDVQGGAGDSFSATQGSFVSGDTLFNTGGAQYYYQNVVTSSAAAGNFVTVEQRIEDVRILAGQTVTVSFWAKVASGTPSIALEMGQCFGTGGAPTGNVTGTGLAQALTTTWTKYSKTFTLGSMSGKTLGTTANTSYTYLTFWLDAGSTWNTRAASIGQATKTVSIGQVMMNYGSVAQVFERRPKTIELALCQRYYAKSYSQGDPPGTSGSVEGYALAYISNCAASQTGYMQATYPVVMRVIPTVLPYNPSTGTSNESYDYANSAAMGCTPYSSDRRVLLVSTEVGAATQLNMAAHWTAIAEL